MCTRGSNRARLGGPSTLPLEARMISALSQLRVVALWYALLGVLCSVGAVVVFSVFWSGSPLWHELASPATSLWIYVGAGVAFWLSAGLSLRYLVLSPPLQGAAFVISAFVALCGIAAAGHVTLTNPPGVGLVAWWGLAGACSLCTLLLWVNRRASNHRWRGP